MQTLKIWFFTLAPKLYACRYSFVMSTHVCNVKLTVVEKIGFECCFWSTQCIERQTRTSDKVKTWVFNSLNVQWWSFLNDVVYYNVLRLIKSALLEVERTMFAVATLAPMLIIISHGAYTCNKQSKTFHAKGNLKVNCEKNCLW